MFAMPSVQGAARVLSRRRILAAAAAAVVVTCVTPLGAALVLAPLTALAVGVLLPFALLWVDFEYEVPLDYWDGLYKSRFGTSGVAARNGPRGETPPVYPNGWFKIAESAEVPPGAVKCVRFMGAELVLFRGAGGQLGLVDAHCPHLGAHMGVGGTVTPDGCLQCPFHGWKFGVDGKCVEIPYSTGSVPPQAATRAHRVTESHRVVLAWHDAEGREPHYTLGECWPEMPSSYNRVGRATHLIPCHISEVPENGADVAHLNFLHTDVHPVLRFLKPLVDMKGKPFFVWTATWEPSAVRSECADMTLTERFVVAGKPVGLVGSDATIRQVGPGLVVLALQTFFGKVVLLQSLTPMEPYLMRLETTAFCSPEATNATLANRLMLLAYAENVERDVLVWGKKRYLSSPLLVKGDGPIAKFRRWYAQFYSPSSPTWDSLAHQARSAAPLPQW